MTVCVKGDRRAEQSQRWLGIVKAQSCCYSETEDVGLVKAQATLLRCAGLERHGKDTWKAPCLWQNSTAVKRSIQEVASGQCVDLSLLCFRPEPPCPCLTATRTEPPPSHRCRHTLNSCAWAMSKGQHTSHANRQRGVNTIDLLHHDVNMYI